MMKLWVFICALYTGAAVAAPNSVEDEGLLWVAEELSTIRDATHQLQIRQVQGSTESFDYDALQLDLTRIITEIKAKVQKKGNPAYQFKPLNVESTGY